MESHVYLQYHPMQGCSAIDPSAGIFAFPFKTPAHRKLEREFNELVNKFEQPDNILRETNKRLVHDNEALRSERENDARERRELRRQNEELQSKVETLEKDRETKMSESREKDKKIDLYQKQIEHFKHTESEAKESYNQLNRLSIEVQKDGRESNQKVNELTEALKLKDKQHDSDNKSRESAIEVLLRKMRVMESKIEDYESRNNRLKEIIEKNNRLKEETANEKPTR